MKNSPPLLLFWPLLLAVVIGCHDKGDQTRPASDATTHAALHGDLQISASAQAAIGLTTALAEQREVRDVITTTGWLATRPSSEVIIKAPTTGFIVPRGGAPEALGQAIVKDQHLADLEVFLSPQEQGQLVTAKEDAERDLQQAQDTLKLNADQLQRAEAVAPTAVSGTRLLELREIVAHARAAEKAAREKLPFLAEGSYDEVHLKPVPVDSPLGGRVVEIHFAPRQLVVAGDPLWTVADWSKLWIRVPVFAADVPRIDQAGPADVVAPGGNGVRQAQPLPIPQATEAGIQTIDLTYEIENGDNSLRPGQAVSVALPRGAQSLEIVIPRTAILWDGMGNSWVYVRSTTDSFRRQKVEVAQPIGENVVVSRGLKKGETVVIRGAEALYGEEFKGQIQLEERERD